MWKGSIRSIQKDHGCSRVPPLTVIDPFERLRVTANSQATASLTSYAGEGEYGHLHPGIDRITVHYCITVFCYSN
jgi:hypothetical protein